MTNITLKELVNWLDLEMQEIDRKKEELDEALSDLDKRWWIYHEIKRKLQTPSP